MLKTYSGMSHGVHLPVVYITDIRASYGVFLTHFTFIQLIKTFPVSMPGGGGGTRTQVDTILSWHNTVFKFTQYFLKIYFNVILWSLDPWFSEVNCPSHKNPHLYLKLSLLITLYPQICPNLPSCVFP
jgi:hypothetical protein